MKRYIVMVLLILLCVLPSNLVEAKNNVENIEIDVIINNDGSANVVQCWNVNTDVDTEFYIPINNIEGMDITDFKVSDDNGAFVDIGNWNISAIFSEKARKYGVIKTKNGYELCWGISEYGKKRYIISYKILNLVASYTDYDGFNYMFINRAMNTFPTNAKVNVSLSNEIPLNQYNAKIWAFGFLGQIEFKDGKIVAYTQTPLSDNNSLIIMVQFDKEKVIPTRKIEQSFDSVKTLALQGSNYQHNFIMLQVNNPLMNVNGEPKAIDEGIGTTPIINDVRTLVPLRAIIEAMGGSVSWSGETSTVTLNYKENTMNLVIDSNTAFLNGQAKELDVAPAVINGRTMLPIRFVTENFGCNVDWDGEQQLITIVY